MKIPKYVTLSLTGMSHINLEGLFLTGRSLLLFIFKLSPDMLEKVLINFNAGETWLLSLKNRVVSSANWLTRISLPKTEIPLISCRDI